MARHCGSYYVRLMVVDRPGVMADITGGAFATKRCRWSRSSSAAARPGEPVPVVLTTHDTEEAAMLRALGRIRALGTVLEPPRLIRVENL